MFRAMPMPADGTAGHPSAIRFWPHRRVSHRFPLIPYPISTNSFPAIENDIGTVLNESATSYMRCHMRRFNLLATSSLAFLFPINDEHTRSRPLWHTSPSVHPYTVPSCTFSSFTFHLNSNSSEFGRSNIQPVYRACAQQRHIPFNSDHLNCRSIQTMLKQSNVPGIEHYNKFKSHRIRGLAH